jgi:hypothetical protein
MDVNKAILNRKDDLKVIKTDLGFATMSGNNKEAERLNVARHLKLIEIKHLEADLV